MSDELKFESVGTLRYVPTGEHRFPLEGECFRDSTGYQIAHTDFCVNQWPIYRVFNLSFVMERLAFDQLCELSRLRADCKRKDEALKESEKLAESVMTYFEIYYDNEPQQLEESANYQQAKRILGLLTAALADSADTKQQPLKGVDTRCCFKSKAGSMRVCCSSAKCPTMSR